MRRKAMVIFMLSDQEILQVALAQSAEDMGASSADFLREENVILPFRLGVGARRYYKEPIAAHLVSYGNNIVAGVSEENAAVIRTYLERFDFYHCFETPNLHWLSERLAPLGQKVCFMAEYYLPDTKRLTSLTCPLETRLLTQGDFEGLYLPAWSNALCEARRELDVLGVGAYDGGRLVGLAACSADCDTMWQIGVDVLPDYRRRGIASALTSRLSLEILARGKVPFYCTAWSNLRSVRNAVASGFLPAWVEMTVKPAEVVDEMNRS